MPLSMITRASKEVKGSPVIITSKWYTVIAHLTPWTNASDEIKHNQESTTHTVMCLITDQVGPHLGLEF